MLRIFDAIQFQQMFGKEKLSQIELGLRCIKGKAKPETVAVIMSNLANGKTKRVDPEFVRNFCKETGVDANFLFGVEPMDEPKRAEYEELNS